MNIKISASLLLVAVIFSSLSVTTVFSQADDNIAEIRARVNDYGVGKKVSVTLKHGVKYKGKIGEIDQDGFSVRDKKTKKSIKFSYADVEKVKKSSYTKWIIIGVAAGAAIAVFIPLSQRCRNEGANALCL